MHKKAITYFCLTAAIGAICASGRVCAKDACTESWNRGSYKTFRQIQDETQKLRGGGKILRILLCSTASDHYFQITMLDQSGKVRVLQLAAR